MIGPTSFTQFKMILSWRCDRFPLSCFSKMSTKNKSLKFFCHNGRRFFHELMTISRILTWNLVEKTFNDWANMIYSIQNDSFMEMWPFSFELFFQNCLSNLRDWIAVKNFRQTTNKAKFTTNYKINLLLCSCQIFPLCNRIVFIAHKLKLFLGHT